MRGNRQTSSLRVLLLIGNWFGLFVGLLSAVVFGFYIADPNFANELSDGDETIKNLVPMIVSLVGFAIITNIFFCSFIINFLRKSDDITLLNNRYIIALFSISVGGLFTPFVLAQMQNIPIKSTVSPKFTISKGYGGNSLIAGSLALALYFGYSLISTKQIFNAGLADQIVVGILSAIVCWGALNCLVFATPNSKAAWDKKGIAYKFMNFIAIINLIFATFVLIWQLIAAVLTIFSIFADLFNKKRGFFGALLSTTFAAYRIAIQLFIIYTINRIIKGIWAKGDTIEYQDYSRLAEKQREYEVNEAQA
ncbi:hypothetical protein [Spiroplasma cantharicola]|uniref:Transmembrane protein n=1 Tax=Spiroplasma cantharicola TaxID=362837 RepID=A0A0M5KJC6_9MOLU|nr:hypothetical protein [Spiroplasma cantharicola]ALD66756.1 hypothetical protein SCANT_v1c08500 [Spiroplasma cantharicola]